jgi:hypothetical protein
MRNRSGDSGWQRAIADGTSWSASDAREAIEEWERSGESMAVFARRHGLAPSRLYWWKHRLQNGSTTATEVGAQLVPMVLRPTGASFVGHTQDGVVVTDGMVRIEIGDVHAVAPEWVATLLRLVRGSGA